MTDLQDKSVLITGGAGLLGRAFSTAVAAAGARVVVADIHPDGARIADAVAAETGSTTVSYERCDITDTVEVREMLSRCVDRYGRLDALVNNAYPRNPHYGRHFEDVTYEDFCDNVGMHLGGYFNMAREASAIMMRQHEGVIVNVASIYGFAAPRFEIYEGTTMTMPVEYAAIKGGLITLTRYLASYLGPHNIRVNAISPGGIEAGQDPSFIRRYTRRAVLGERMARPDDITGPLLFLLSDDARYMTGQNVVVDGGWTL